jgi:hypothetical protein
MCLTFIRTCFSRNKVCVNSKKNILGHSNCCTVKLNRHSEHTYGLTEVPGSSDQLRKIKVPDPAPDSKLAQDPEFAPDLELTSDPEQALDPELAPEGSGSSYHLGEI